MADIWEAYKFLNESLKLGLDDETMASREFYFKEMFAKKNGLLKAVGDFDPEKWEFFAELVPQNAVRRRERALKRKKIRRTLARRSEPK